MQKKTRWPFLPAALLTAGLLNLLPVSARAISPQVAAEVEAIFREAATDEARERAAYGSLANPEVLNTKLQQLQRRTGVALAGIARREAAFGQQRGDEAATYIRERAPTHAAEVQRAAQIPQSGASAATPANWYAQSPRDQVRSPPIQPTQYTAAPAGYGRPGQWYDNPFLARYQVAGAPPSAAPPQWTTVTQPAPLVGLSTSNLPPAGGPMTTAEPDVWDPVEPLNRIFFAFNEVVDTFLLRPAAWLYSFSPSPVKTGVRNALQNLKSPTTMLNHGLQGQMTQAATTVGRFAVNSTVGVLGLWDAADAWLGWKHKPADFGQTLHTYGIGNGPFLFLPVLGPTNLRDGVGSGVDAVADPLNYILNDNARMAITGVTALSKREELLKPLDELRAGSVDYYASLRSSSQQRRAAFLRGGAGPTATEIKKTDDLFNDMK